MMKKVLFDRMLLFIVYRLLTKKYDHLKKSWTILLLDNVNMNSQETEKFIMNTSFISTNQRISKRIKVTLIAEMMECMRKMFEDILESTLQAEMDQHLGYDKAERKRTRLTWVKYEFIYLCES